MIIARYDGARSRLKLGNSLRRLQTIRRTFENLARKRGARVFDWTFVTHYAPFFVNGAAMTLFISVFGIVLSIVSVSSARALKSHASQC